MKLKLNWKKIKFFLSLHWIKILLGLVGLSLVTGLVILMVNGIHAWHNASRFMKQQQLAMMPLQLFFFIIVGIIQGCVFVFLYSQVLFKRGFGQGQKKKAIKGEDVKISWNDVIGMEEAKQEASEVVKLITDRAELQRIGGKILRGILMVGPPGCGKTYLAKAIATESRLPFIAMSGSEFVEMFVGVGASRVRSLFKNARNLAEMEGGCIIFIDEIDAVGAQRSGDRGFGGQTETNRTVNQLLVEMDGLKDQEHNVIVIGATNAPMNYLDQALLRPGRFDRVIHAGLPGLEDREKLFEYYLKKVKYEADTLSIPRLARRAVQKSPADIANLVREAALLTVRHKKPAITMKEINESMDRIELGVKRNIKQTAKEKEMVAYHEAGHAIIAYLLNPTDDVMKASILPRAEALGVVYTPPREETHLDDREKLLAKIKVSLGSYVAEKIKFGRTTQGVEGDFKKAILNAHNMVWRWGMGKSGYLGNYGFLNAQTSGWSASQGSVISEKVKEQLNEDTQEILVQCQKEVEELLTKQRPLLDRFSQELVKKQELDYDEIDAIFKEFNLSRPNS
ncbi:AAA family ATPase [Candidatus Omnitrophota bacterium]